MVALVTHGVDGIPIGIHRTFLRLDGSGKAAVKPAKMMLGPCRGGVVRLAELGEVLMVGEGIETCLAAMQASGHTAWAALSTSGLRTLDLPREVRDVIVIVDGDDPGEAAARECAWRWKREGRRVRIARAGSPHAWQRGGRVMNTFDAGRDAVRGAIVGAEEVTDPLDGLVDRITADPGAAFVPEVVERLATLKRDDRAAFEALRTQLKKAGCRVTVLDDAIAKESGEAGGRRPTQADILIELARSAEFFHAPDGTGFADIEVNGHRETWPIRARGFRRWLFRRFFEATGGGPSSEALQSALNVIEANAHYDAPERIVHVRIGGQDGRPYLDLCNDTWQALEINPDGWRIVDNPPVRFRRAAGMQALPSPVPGGSVDALRSFLNVRSDADFVLVIAWALACLRDRGPYPVMVLSGEQGSAKSTFSA
ncbi:toprim domain-containing protein [Nordella sp. HKS 07]|uniref:toprim domain-containing protein n=1 Tax=Nordella sp. HKS 07 TaxID=2712222 RepID=UPI001FEEB4AD|nr:toprim domain-containing protein [Nordella sp. HKS 07]